MAVLSEVLHLGCGNRQNSSSSLLPGCICCKGHFDQLFVWTIQFEICGESGQAVKAVTWECAQATRVYIVLLCILPDLVHIILELDPVDVLDFGQLPVDLLQPHLVFRTDKVIVVCDPDFAICSNGSSKESHSMSTACSNLHA